MITLTPSIRLKIASNLLSLNDDDLVLISGIIADIKNDKYKKEVYKLVEELDGEEDFLRGGDNAMILIQTNNSLRKKINKQGVKNK